MNSTVKKALELRRVVSAFFSSRIILTANNYRIFDYLEKRWLSPTEVANTIKVNKRAVEILLDALVSLGFLKKSKYKYRNTPFASKFLVKGKPYYQGDIIRHYNTLWDNWSGLDIVLKRGKPYRKSDNHEAFIHGMHNIAVLKANKIIKYIPLKGVKKVLDLGGGPGTYSMVFAKKHCDVTLFDFPETLKIAKHLISKEGFKDKIKFMAGDFLVDPIGKDYDLIFISQVLHAYNPSDCTLILRKVFDALNPQGIVVIHEFYLDKTRASPTSSALFAVNMLINTEGGRSYTPEELRTWLKNTGFSNIKQKIIPEPFESAGVLICARKNP
jgi:ubiquinone/menaquinone biosynthesis C-methylase UbiE